MSAGVHEAGVLRLKAFLHRNMVGGAGFGNADAVHIEAECCDGAGTAGFDLSNDAGEFAGFLDELCRHAVRDGAFNRFLNLFLASSERMEGINVGDAGLDGESELAQLLCDEPGGFKFRPAFLRMLVEFSARLRETAEDVGISLEHGNGCLFKKDASIFF